MAPYAFFRKQFMPLAEAKIGILTHALHYGTACFEGIRGNWNDEQEQLFLFRVKDHYERMLKGCRILKINIPYSADEMCQLTVKLVEKSGYHEDVYIRPLAYKRSVAIGVRLHNLDDDFFIIVATLPAYLDAEKGVRCCTSSWRRVDDTMIPPRGKITGIYVNSALAKTEANVRGFDEAILLNHDGHVSEGSGENIFIVRKGKLKTTPLTSILEGITRNSIMEIARDEGIEVVEERFTRDELYIADEAFFTGTAAEITPIREVDGRTIGKGKPGEITKKVQSIFFDAVKGRNKRYKSWLTKV